MQHSHLPGRILWFMFPETEIRYPPREMVARGHKWIRFPQTWVSTGSSVPSIFPHPFPLDGTPRIEKELTMYKHLVYALLLLCATGAWAYGQDPDLQASDANSPPSGPALSPAPTPVDQASNQALSFDESCGCQSTTSCAPYGSVYQRPSLKEKCAYYRAIRQSYRDEPCCGDYFGGFGALWESYCADKQRGCGCETACEPAAACPPAIGCRNGATKVRLPVLHFRGMRARHHCAEGDVTCDCASAGVGMPEDAPLEIGTPPSPTEAAPAAEPAASPQLDASHDPPPEKTTSARRGWIQRTMTQRNVGWQTNR